MKASFSVDKDSKTISVKAFNNLNLSEVVTLLSEVQKTAEKFKYSNQKFSFENEIDSDAFEDMQAYKTLANGLNRILVENHNITN